MKRTTPSDPKDQDKALAMILPLMARAVLKQKQAIADIATALEQLRESVNSLEPTLLAIGKAGTLDKLATRDFPF